MRQLTPSHHSIDQYLEWPGVAAIAVALVNSAQQTLLGQPVFHGSPSAVRLGAQGRPSVLDNLATTDHSFRPWLVRCRSNFLGAKTAAASHHFLHISLRQKQINMARQPGFISQAPPGSYGKYLPGARGPVAISDH